MSKIYTNEADGYRVAHFGHGGLVVGTGRDRDSPNPFDDELVIMSSPVTGGIGDSSTHLYEGKDSSHFPGGIRLVFDNAEGFQVLIDTLLKLQSLRMAHEIEADIQEVGGQG